MEFNRLTDREKTILKHWLRNTVDETIAGNAVKILESSKEEVEKMVANNAFMIKEMKEKVKKETEKEVRKQDRIEVVENAVRLGMDDETISKLTGLSEKEIAQIRMKYN